MLKRKRDIFFYERKKKVEKAARWSYIIKVPHFNRIGTYV